jgi:hypothetical protein
VSGMTPEAAPVPEGQPAGWLVLDPDGNPVAAGPQTALNASADAGQET